MTNGADTLPLPPELFVGVFLLLFPVLWLFAAAAVGSMGWRRLANDYSATDDPPFSADQVRWGSLRIGSGLMSPSYGSCINGWFSQRGFWLRPTLLFRPFHPMMFVPWTRVQSVEVKMVLMFQRVQVSLAGDVPDLQFSGRLGDAVIKHRPV